MRRIFDEAADRAILSIFFLSIAVVTVFSPRKGLQTVQNFLTDP
jgi:hypothetical protein